MTKIIRLVSENVLRLKAVDITPTSNVVLIGGLNGQGKTSVLQSIAMGLGGADAQPDMPVRVGEKKAKIVLELEDIVVKRTFTEAGNSVLYVENKEGARYPKPQDMLDKLTGKLTFDPLEFMRLKPAAQLEALKKIVGLDFTAQDAKRAQVYMNRTLLNAQAKTAKAKAEFMESFPEAPAAEVSVSDLVTLRDQAKEHNAKLDGLKRNHAEAEELLGRARGARRGLEEEIRSLELRLSELRRSLVQTDENIPAIETRVKAAQEAVDSFKLQDVAYYTKQIAEVEMSNIKVRRNKARADALVEAGKIEAEADKLTEQIDAIDKAKADALAATKFPVPGLSFNENGVLFNGVPLVQASGAEQLRVSLAIAAALNPRLRVMLIRDGSLLDENSMKLLTAFAVERDLQVWLEVVGTDDPSAIIIEDGAVKPVKEEVVS